MDNELKYKDISYNFNIDDISLKNIKSDIPGYEDIFNKIETALNIKKEGYNAFIVDDCSKYKIKNIMRFIKQKFEKRSKPKDICYVTDDDERSPVVIFLSCGRGKLLKSYVKEIKDAYIEKIFNFYHDNSDEKKEEITDNLQKDRSRVVTEVVDKAHEYGFDIKPSTSGFAFMPIKDYDGGLNDEKDNSEKISELKKMMVKVIEKLKEFEENAIKDIKVIYKNYFEDSMSKLEKDMESTFNGDMNAYEYIKNVSKKIEDYAVLNYSMDYDEDFQKINEFIQKFEVNVLVDNSRSEHPNVIYEEDPSILNLIGNVGFENKNGSYDTNINFIKAGSLLKANEGCLIVKADSILDNRFSYYYLKKVLTTGKLDFVNLNNYYDLLLLNGLKPQPINVDVKVIMIGNYETFNLLYNYDEDFKKIFKVCTGYNPIVDINDKNKRALVENIILICMQHGYRKVTDGGIKLIAKYLSSLAEDRNKYYYDDNEIDRILTFSDNAASKRGKDEIDKCDIESVIYSKKFIENEVIENYSDKKILLKLNGNSIGQVNGLSVIESGDFVFGKPFRVTCSCFKGSGNIIDVHKENNLSGSIHSMSISILKGYLERLNSSYLKLPVDFNLSFEQVYGKVEGDSASVAEVISMISALSRIPVKQNIAVTGSINQFGEIQPIGGVNIKIEGFYKICKSLSDCKDKGVLIPSSNIDSLVLSDEIEEDVKKGNFHIYSMKNVDDAVSTLMTDKDVSLDDVKVKISKEIKKYTDK